MDKKPYILIVSDADNLNFWNNMQSDIDQSVGPVRTALETEILHHGINNHFDLIVVDSSDVARLPGLIRVIRASQAGVKILIVTATPTWKQAREAYQIGASDYIRKPNSSEDLTEELKKVLFK